MMKMMLGGFFLPWACASVGAATANKTMTNQRVMIDPPAGPGPGMRYSESLGFGSTSPQALNQNYQCMTKPPSTLTHCPVMFLPCPDARYTAIAAISSG